MIDTRFIKGIDLNRTYCNEINTINKYFGIEAARSALLKNLIEFLVIKMLIFIIYHFSRYI